MASVNTSSKSWANKQKMRRLSISLWDFNAQLSINEMSMDPNKGYPITLKDTGLKQTMRLETISELISILTDVKDHIKKTGDLLFDDEMVTYSNDKHGIQITNGESLKNLIPNITPGIYLVLYKNINSDKVPETYAVYPLNIRYTIKGFTPKDSASGKKIPKITQELKEIIKALEECERSSVRAHCHYNQITESGEVMKQLAYLSAIAMTVGADVNLSDSGDNSNKGGSSPSYEDVTVSYL